MGAANGENTEQDKVFIINRMARKTEVRHIIEYILRVWLRLRLQSYSLRMHSVQ